jgi:membrane-associated protein
MSGLLDPTHLINTFGLIGMVAILFAECGLPMGLFLPGDSLVFTAGLLEAS